MRILKTLIILVLLIFPFGELVRFDLGNNIAIKPLDTLVAVCFIWWLAINKFSLKKISSAFLAFATIGLVSLLFNISWLKEGELLTSFLYLFRWVAYGSMLFIVSQTDEKFKKIVRTFLFVDGIIIVIFGFVQYVFYNSLKNLLYLGWDEHMHRIFSSFFDPNFTGAFYVLFLIFLAGETYSLWKKHKQRQSLMTACLLVITLVAILLTYSRSAFVMLVIGSITFLTLIQKKRFVFLILGIILFFGVVVSPKFHDENMNLFRMHSVGGRIANNKDALEIIKKRVILGVGFNTYRYAKLYFGFREGWLNFPSHADAGVDNSFLFVLATTGIVGLAAYLWLWLEILKRAFLYYKKKLNTGSLIVISSSIALFADAFFINSLFFAPIMLWMWLMVALMKEN